MKKISVALVPAIIGLMFIPAIAGATALSDLTAATAANTIDSGNNGQQWNWNALTSNATVGLSFQTTGTTAATGQTVLLVASQGANSTSGVTSWNAVFANSHTGTNSTNFGATGTAQGGSQNFGIVGNLQGTSSGDAGVWGKATQTTGATYGVLGTNASAAGYAGYFNNTAGGYAAAFMGGNVGIGGSSPNYKLDVTNGSSQIRIGTSAVDSGGFLTSAADHSASITGGASYNGTNWIAKAITSGSVAIWNGVATIYTDTGLTIGNSFTQTPRVTISSSGVGIGTTSPTALLHTVDSAAKTAAYTGVLHSVTDTSGTASVNKVGMDIESTGTWNGTSAVNTGLVVNATGGSTNYAATFSGGNVGIGTTSPNSMLQVGVDGTAQAVTIPGSQTSIFAGRPTIDNAQIKLGSFGTTQGGGVEFQVSQGGSGYGWKIAAPNYSSGSDNSSLLFLLRTNSAAWSEVMRINSTGNVGIATASPSYPLQVTGSIAATAYVTTSDIRHKTKIEPLGLGLKEVQQLRPVTFEWNDTRNPKDPAMKHQQIGFIAQDVEKVMPSMVVTEDNDEKTKGMKYSELIPVLTKAIQEQQVEIDKLTAQLAGTAAHKQ